MGECSSLVRMDKFIALTVMPACNSYTVVASPMATSMGLGATNLVQSSGRTEILQLTTITNI